MDAEYLKQTVGPCLVQCLAEVCLKRPADPIEYIALWLQKHNQNVLYDKQVEDEAKELERQRAEHERLQELLEIQRKEQERIIQEEAEIQKAKEEAEAAEAAAAAEEAAAAEAAARAAEKAREQEGNEDEQEREPSGMGVLEEEEEEEVVQNANEQEKTDETEEDGD